MSRPPEEWTQAVDALPLSRAVCEAGRRLQYMGAMDDAACHVTLKYMLLAMNEEQRETLAVGLRAARAETGDG